MDGYAMVDMVKDDYNNTDTNLTVQGLLNTVNDQQYDVTTICSSTDFIARHVIRPAVEASLHTYLNACAATGEALLSDSWSLCDDGDDGDRFNCDTIYAYTNACKTTRRECQSSSFRPTSAPDGKVFRMEDLMENPASIALLVGLVILGILIGVVSTISVCLIWPGVHRWANRKLGRSSEKSSPGRQSEKSSRKLAVSRGDSMSSSYYTDIDDRQRQTIVALRPLNTAVSNSTSTGSSGSGKSRPRRFSDPAYNDSELFATGSRYHAHYSESPLQVYDQLHRNMSQKSNKYAQITQQLPTTSPNDYHSYFVLEKNG